ncbi:MAG: hypothetical protein P4L84_13895, partial [Isosphaeraceae bacterium]|nr:hypothetical protein [Isosphaeraceae bacterium]
DRHVRRIVLGLILVFPVLLTWMSPPPPPGVRRPQGMAALAPLAGVEAILIAGLLGAYRARRGLLAVREELTVDARESLTEAHFAPASSPSVLEATTR